MEVHNWKLHGKYEKLKEEDTRCEEIFTDDADFLVVAFGSCARIVQSAIWNARSEGIRAALLRPITVYPFPEKRLSEITRTIKKVLTGELNTGQRVDDVRLSVQRDADVFLHARPGGGIPTPEEILEQIKKYY